jgi:tetratricopeptide (TPR) repeat protein
MKIALAAAVLALAAVPTRAAVDDRSHKEALKHYRAGQTALQTERWADAEEEFRLATTLDPLFVAAHYGTGQTMMATKRYPQAVDAFIAAREAFAQGQVVAAADEMAMQRRLDDQIKALQDDNSTARRQSSGSNATAIQSAITRNEEQIKTLQSLRRRGGEGPLPTPHWLSFALGSAYFRAGDLAKAEQEYRAALAQKPDLGEGHLNLGVVCMLTGRLDEAEREITLAEKAGVRIPPGLKDDLRKRRGSTP